MIRIHLHLKYDISGKWALCYVSEAISRVNDVRVVDVAPNTQCEECLCVWCGCVCVCGRDSNNEYIIIEKCGNAAITMVMGTMHRPTDPLP